ncbi:hypothetical protein Droror1_Dr00002289, partial [Drosera rotundifolia]
DSTSKSSANLHRHFISSSLLCPRPIQKASQYKYIDPVEAFSEIPLINNKSLEILNSKNHTEVGAADSGSSGGPPYFWCILFSNGKSNSSFVLADCVAKVSRPGCFSGAKDAACFSVELIKGG